MSQRSWLVLAILVWACDVAADKPRARDLGIPFDGTPGALNAITDVAGIEVGHTTLIEGSGPLVRGEGPVRTGVTAVLPIPSRKALRRRRCGAAERCQGNVLASLGVS